MANLSRQKSSKATAASQLGFQNQRLWEGHPTENQGGQPSQGGRGMYSINGQLSTLRLHGELPGEFSA